MIEWVPIKEFLDQVKDEKEYFLLYHKKNKCVMTASLLTCSKDTMLISCPYAAKINFPVEKTLEEKFEDYRNSVHVNDLRLYTSNLALIAKNHFEVEK